MIVRLQGVEVKMVSAGAEHTVAITASGKLFGWGWGRYGNLGLGDCKDRLVPAEVTTLNVCTHFCTMYAFGKIPGFTSRPHPHPRRNLRNSSCLTIGRVYIKTTLTILQLTQLSFLECFWGFLTTLGLRLKSGKFYWLLVLF